MMARTARRRAATAEPQSAIAHIESLDYDGHGVAHVEGKAVFIDDALPGETVRFRYRRRRRRHDMGTIEEVLEPSADRVTPPCRYFGTCGGCSLQHLAPAAQLRAKQKVLADNLTHLGNVEPENWLAPVTGPAFGYRRRARLGVRQVPAKGGVLMGFRERRQSFITNLDECLTLEPAASHLLAPLRTCISHLSCANRIPQVEFAIGDNATALVLRHLEPLTPDDHAALGTFALEHDVQLFLQPGGLETVHPLANATYEPLFYSLPAYSVSLFFAATDFIQVNRAVNEQMVARAIELLAPQVGDVVLDLFCGLGNFTLPIARHASSVLGVEGDAALAARGEANAAANGIGNASFEVGDLFTGQGPWWVQGFNKVLLDPPRAGAIAAIKALSTVKPERIVYVSCNPATLARDAQYLVHMLGYRMESAGVIDMFPQTSHAEAIARFLRD